MCLYMKFKLIYNLLQFFMKFCFLYIILFFTIAYTQIINSVASYTQIQQEIYNTEELIRLYSEKLEMLKNLKSNYKNYSQLSAVESKQFNIIPKYGNFSSYQTYFIPPSYILSQTILYDLSKRPIQKVIGKVLIVSLNQITTLIQKQVNLILIKQKVSQQLWGFQKQNLPSLWVYIKGERTLVQYEQNKIYLTNKHGKKQILWQKQIIKILRMQMHLLVICRNDFGRINLVDFQKRNFVLPFQIQILDFTFDLIHNSNIFLVSTDHKIRILDFNRNHTFAQITIKPIQKPKLYSTKNFLFVTSPNSPQLLIFNITMYNRITEITPLQLCPSDDPSTIYDYKIHSYLNSIFILCSRKSQKQQFSKLFEILLPELMIEELIPRWIQYLIIPTVIFLCILYKRRKIKNEGGKSAKKQNKKSDKVMNNRNKPQTVKGLRQLDKSKLQRMIREQSQKILNKNLQQNLKNIDPKLLLQKKNE